MSYSCSFSFRSPEGSVSTVEVPGKEVNGDTVFSYEALTVTAFIGLEIRDANQTPVLRCNQKLHLSDFERVTVAFPTEQGPAALADKQFGVSFFLKGCAV